MLLSGIHQRPQFFDVTFVGSFFQKFTQMTDDRFVIHALHVYKGPFIFYEIGGAGGIEGGGGP